MNRPIIENEKSRLEARNRSQSIENSQRAYLDILQKQKDKEGFANAASSLLVISNADLIDRSV
jgi:hypothetical protein